MKYPISTRRSGALLGLIAVIVLATAACSSDDGTADTTTSTTAPATTTTAPVTTTIAPVTTTAAPVTTTTVAVTTTTVDTNTLADGSGCTPGDGELPDGLWYGVVATATDAELGFDLACWFSGNAAVLASAADGEESPPPNDYYVRNVSDHVRPIAVAGDAEVTWLPSVGDPTTEATVAYAEWLVGRDQRGVELQPGIWLTIEGGEATSIVEQYVP